jgi:hypothetical protein
LGTGDSGASSLEDETTAKDVDHIFGSDCSEYGSEEIDQEEERRSAESLEESDVSNKDEEEESDQPELLFKVKQTSSSKRNKSNTETSNKILQIDNKNNAVNQVKQLDENQTEEADDEYKSDTSDEEVCSNCICSLL